MIINNEVSFIEQVFKLSTVTHITEMFDVSHSIPAFYGLNFRRPDLPCIEVNKFKIIFVNRFASTECMGVIIPTIHCKNFNNFIRDRLRYLDCSEKFISTWFEERRPILNKYSLIELMVKLYKDDTIRNIDDLVYKVENECGALNHFEKNFLESFNSKLIKP